MSPSAPAANPYTQKKGYGYKGVQQKHIHKRDVPKKTIVSLPVNNLPPPISEDNEDEDDILSLAPDVIFPAKKLVLPTEFKNFKNGKLPDGRLKPVKCGGQMYAPVAVWFDKMYDAALAAGFKLRNVGDYRSFKSQLTLFESRYSDVKPIVETVKNYRVKKSLPPTFPDDDKLSEYFVTRMYEDKTWYLKYGKAPSATPGTSNHGWGLAMDLAYEVKGKLTSMGGKCFNWLCGNAPKYGFYLQYLKGKNDRTNPEFEAWHWQYCLGDKSPAPDDIVSTSSTSLPIGEMKLDENGMVIHDDDEEA